MKIKKVYREHSLKGLLEEHKPLIPTVIYWHGNINKYHLIQLKFAWWKYWYKIYIGIQLNSRNDAG